MAPPQLSVVQVQTKLSAKQKQAKAAELRSKGWTWHKIADELGYAHPKGAFAAVQAYFRDYPAPNVDEHRREANNTLDKLAEKAWIVLENFHPVISASGKIVGRYTGKYVKDEFGDYVRDAKDNMVPEVEEFEDDGPVLAAITVVLRIEERRAKLNGTDKPVKISINEESEIDKEMQELAATMEARAVALANKGMSDGAHGADDTRSSEEVPGSPGT